MKFDDTSKTVNWFKFKAAFVAAVGCRRARDEEKLLHLFGLLEGSPLALASRVAGDEYNRETYAEVWRKLEEAYGGKERKRYRLYEELQNWPRITEFTHKNTLELTVLIANLTRAYTDYNGGRELDSAGTINIAVQNLLPPQEARRYFRFIDRERRDRSLLSLYEFLECERKALASAAILNSKSVSKAYASHEEQHYTGSDCEDDGSSSRGVGASESTCVTSNNSNQQKGDTPKQIPCEKCNGTHRLWACPDFLAMTMPLRFKMVQEKRLCFHCLCIGHRAKDCNFKRDVKCGINDCQHYHNRLLHQDKESGLLTIGGYCRQAELLEQSSVTSNFTFFTGGNEYDAIRTIPCYIVAPSGQKERIWAALDSCSTSTNIDADTAKRLNLKIEQASIDRHIGVLQSSVKIVSDRVSFTLQSLDGKNMFPVHALTVKNLIEGTPVVDWHQVAEEYPYLRGAKPPKSEPKDRVRVLVGVDHNHLTIASANLQGRHDEPFAEYCKLGWSFSGRVKRDHVINRHSEECNFTGSFILNDKSATIIKREQKEPLEDSKSQPSADSTLQDSLSMNHTGNGAEVCQKRKSLRRQHRLNVLRLQRGTVKNHIYQPNVVYTHKQGSNRLMLVDRRGESSHWHVKSCMHAQQPTNSSFCPDRLRGIRSYSESLSHSGSGGRHFPVRRSGEQLDALRLVSDFMMGFGNTSGDVSRKNSFLCWHRSGNGERLCQNAGLTMSSPKLVRMPRKESGRFAAPTESSKTRTNVFEKSNSSHLRRKST